MGREAVGSLAVIIGANAMPFDRELARVQRESSAFGKNMASSTTVDLARNTMSQFNPASGAGSLAPALAGLGPVGAAAGAAIAGGMVAAKLAADALSASVAVVADGLKWAGSRAVELAADYEIAAVKFGVMTGSPDVGKDLLGKIDRLAIATPYGSRDLSRGAEMLMGSGVKADNVLPMLKALGDVAAGDTERFQRLAYALGQVTTAGRLTGMELRQFSEAGVAAEDFARAMKVPVADFMAMVSDSRVGLADVYRTFNQLTGAGGRMENLSIKVGAETVSGQWNAVKESVDVALREIGLKAFKALDLAPALGRLADWASNAQQHVDPLFAHLERAGGVARDVWGAAARIWDAGTAAVAANGDALAAIVPAYDEVRGIVKELTHEAVLFAPHFLTGFAEIGDALRETLIDPLLTAIVTIERLESRMLRLKAAGVEQLPGGGPAAAMLRQQADLADASAAETTASIARIKTAMEAASNIARDAAGRLLAPPAAAPPPAAGAKPGDNGFIGPIQEPGGPARDVVEFAQKWRSELVQGATAADAYRIQQDRLTAAMRDNLLTAEQGRTAHRRLHDEFAKGVRSEVPNDATAMQKLDAERRVLQDRMRVDPAFIPERYELALGKHVQQLAGTFEKGEQKMAGAMSYGSQQAESVITKAMGSGEKEPMKRVEDLLKRIADQERATAKDTRDMARALDKLSRQQGVGF